MFFFHADYLTLTLLFRDDGEADEYQPDEDEVAEGEENGEEDGGDDMAVDEEGAEIGQYEEDDVQQESRCVASASTRISTNRTFFSPLPTKISKSAGKNKR